MPKSLADGHIKLTLCTIKPAIPGAPTAAELNDGLDVSLAVLASDYTFGATDSDSFSERAVGEAFDAEAYGISKGQFSITIFRQFEAGGQVDDAADTAYAAVKSKGTTVWAYERRNGKLASEGWAADDEIRYGAEVITDNPQDPGQGGYIKAKVPGKIQKAWPDVTILAGDD